MTDVSSRHPRWQRRPEARAEEILEAAVAVFGEMGFARANLCDVAQRAGVSKGTVYLYFENKEALFREMVRSRMASSFPCAESEAAERDSSARVALARVIAGMWNTVRAPAMAQIVHLVHSEIGNFPDLARFYFDEVIAPVRRMLRGLLERGIAQDEFRAVNTDFEYHEEQRLEAPAR